MREALLDALAAARRDGSMVGVLYVDVDLFKRVNDTFTHAGGDQLLRLLARRLRASLREEDVVSRVGGDEFVCVLRGLATPDAVHRPVESLIGAASGDYELSGRTMRVSVSVGVAVGPGGTDAEGLLADADAALYRAKAAGRDCWRLAT